MDSDALLHPFEGDKLKEECGVFGVFQHDEAAKFTVYGLHALQHRGQEGVGIAAYDAVENRFNLERHMGLVGDVFGENGPTANLKGRASIGHVRYSTTGGSLKRNVQPFFADVAGGGIAVAHNGNLTNAKTLREDLQARGAIFYATSDTEVIVHLIATSRQRGMVNRMIDALHQVEGAYSLVALTRKRLIGVRDPLGVRPLALGRLGDTWILASETCAFDIIGATFVRDVEPGELVEITEEGVTSHFPFPHRKKRFCIFEHVYFSRPDSVVEGMNVYEARKRIGVELAKEAPIDADIVVAVPDSGNPAAIGYAQASGLPFEMGIIRNHYVGRTFIEPTDQIRNLGVLMKHNANRPILEGKRVILVDDSIVRGTTSLKIVQMVREGGAKEVHMRIASPPTTNPCFYGVDTPNKDKLLAARMNLDVEAMRQFIKADSLAFISLDGLYRAVGETGRNNAHPQYCDACFSGDYPTMLTDQDQGREFEQLSLLMEQA
jgi:amidophosphoribosyltransferase